ncbi:30S ribosomal protein S21 [candidate division WWE3 bacterium CG08_land_8_20_14_0_20_41_15]|uniref:Small ribosomal subunit protein bS21 n=1 Tax=candidate division WWE3 bacterium CG08_land_8_20_14_0_20_41_15 TaxID=1975086 RepID=A0A2H0XA98_UNCKA|nr:MAG: 30S ribosomal protein S21 [candidate division WWE3 bacterium CG08_land_8_20_14_0_20_41_15]
MAKVVLREGESLEQALRRFTMQVQEEEIMEELEKRKYYIKPSVIRRQLKDLKKFKYSKKKI